MKRILTLTLAGIMTASSIVYAADFSDLKSGHWAYDNISAMQEIGVIDGYEDGTFRPEKHVTRGEAAKILSKLSGISEGTAEFSDVKETDWFAVFAKAVGEYIPGENDEFDGNTAITREEAAVAAVRILNIPQNKMALTFLDKENITYKGEIAAAVAEGIITGFEDNTFRPEEKLTRAQLCAMYSRAFLKEQESEAPEVTETKPSEKTWVAEMLCDADIENFMTDADINENGRLMFIETDETELVFQYDFEAENPCRAILWNTGKIAINKGDGSGKYSDFVPLSLSFDEYNERTYMFGYFKKFTDSSGDVSDIQEFIGLEVTYDRASIYFAPDKNYIPYEGKYMPEFLFMSAERDVLIYNGRDGIFRFERKTGRYDGEIYEGKENSFKEFLNNGTDLFALDKNGNLMHFDFDVFEWEAPINTLSADVTDTKDGLFWLWNTEEGKLYTADSAGKETLLYDDMSFENIELSGLKTEKLDGHMKVLDKDRFVVYDGTSLYLISRSQG